ncbi:class I SAM-dependent methyltransferase [Turneriella parva]|uniref:Methyltransferase type 11 n=1 Tax=Turneriella parva (strain ATCC BAA-1111 / DSM 21527 / NCTC 11395 / H) TaxID=869212 RepID=I4B5T1_TURPD|nr:class I SAM-dependent methyltransferase [Turneriella parva]AFM12638.1 Methyltransferase type 11 [Turneriella parva DSM 21527]
MSNEHNGWYNKIFSAAYDPFMSVVEKNALSGRRRALLGNLSGRVLELGCGTGINFEFYAAAAEVLAIEPSDAMRTQALDKLSREKFAARIRVEPWLLEDERLVAAYPAGSFDAVVCTLVLCTVPDPAATLALLYRQLKPGGKLIALEHVRAKSGLGQSVQNLMNPFWRHLAEGCQLNRDTHATIEAAGFHAVKSDEFDYGLLFIAGVYRA